MLIAWGCRLSECKLRHCLRDDLDVFPQGERLFSKKSGHPPPSAVWGTHDQKQRRIFKPIQSSHRQIELLEKFSIYRTADRQLMNWLSNCWGSREKPSLLLRKPNEQLARETHCEPLFLAFASRMTSWRRGFVTYELTLQFRWTKFTPFKSSLVA